MGQERVQQQLFIIGAGGHGSELCSYVADLRRSGVSLELVGYIDEHKPAGDWGATRILGSLADLRRYVRDADPGVRFYYITAIGDNRARVGLVQRISDLGLENLEPWTLRHPAAITGASVEVGVGTCLAPGCVVTTRVRIGRHCIVNVQASVSHDCVVEDFVNVNPGATVCGNVRLGEGSYIGAGATVINDVEIGAWSVVGAGAVVVDDVPSHVTVVGVPARISKRHRPDEE